MQFEVRALSANNEVMRLIIHADDISSARAQARSRGLTVAAIAPKRPSLVQRLQGMASLAASDSLLLFAQELLALLTAGLSLFEALEALVEKEEREPMLSVLSGLLSGLCEGKRFSSVLSQQGDFFPLLFVGLIRSAEGTGNFHQALSRYIEYQQRRDQVRNKVLSAAIYPVILLSVGGLVTLFLIGYVVPRFAEVYEGAGRELPWMSELLLSWGRFAAQNMAGILIAVAVAIGGLALILVHHGKNLLWKTLHRLPGVGARIRIFELSRLYLTLGMLLEGGVPISTALETLRDLTSSILRDSVVRAKQSIETGAPCSQAFSDHGLVTPVSLRMLRVGEKSGQLGQMLMRSAAFYESEMSRWIDRFTRSFEPLLMAAIGLVVGAIVVLLYMPIFDLAGSLS